MKKVFFMLMVSCFALILGLSSCKKESCQDCFTFTYYGTVSKYCEDNYVTRTLYDNALSSALANAPSQTQTTKECD